MSGDARHEVGRIEDRRAFLRRAARYGLVGATGAFLINDVSAQGHAFYLVSIVRSRNDGMTGFTGSLARPIISRRSRNGVRRYLEYVKSQMEH